MRALKVCVWMNMPSHHQIAFFRALCDQGVDLVVRYYGVVSAERVNMGWAKQPDLAPFECYVESGRSIRNALSSVEDWPSRVHVVPGYGSFFSLRLIALLCWSRTQWVHWSEPSELGLRWWRSAPMKIAYAVCVNRFALGALAIGELAVTDFRSWGIRPEKIALLPYSIPPPRLLLPAAATDIGAIDSDRKVFMYVGRLIHLKGVDLLVRAFAAARQSMGSNKNWLLVLVGSGDQEAAIRKLIADLALMDSTMMIASIPFDQIGSYMQAADVLILPSRRFDGWGAVVSEAAALGKAIVASTTVGAAYHLIVPGLNGFRPRAGDVADLTDCLRAYMANPGLAQQHGSHSRALYEGFSPQQNALRFCKAIETWTGARIDA